MKRANLTDTFMQMAITLSKRSTCLDKQVGCIITNSKNEIIATGYNGAPRGYLHCTDIGFCRKDCSDNSNDCPSAHAEQNALLQCRVPEQIHSIYVTLSPCISCLRIIMNTPCERIIYMHEHKHPEAKTMWKGEWIQWEKWS